MKFQLHEVLQISQMDCAPAALASFALGYGVDVDYQQLRLHCQTDADGTSYADLVDVAENYLDLPVTLSVVPIEHLLEEKSEQLPSITIRRDMGVGHSILVANSEKGKVTLMDPSVGVLADKPGALAERLYPAIEDVDAGEWRDYAQAPAFLAPLKRRLKALGFRETEASALVQSALDDSTWYSIARLDAAIRCTESILKKKLMALDQAPHVVRTAFEETQFEIPTQHWYARRVPSAHDRSESESAEVELRLNGVYSISLDHARFAQRGIATNEARRETTGRRKASVTQSPWPFLLKRVSVRGKVSLLLLSVAVGLIAVFEAVILRGILDVKFFERVGAYLFEVGATVLALLVSSVVAVWASRRFAYQVGNRLGAEYRMDMRNMMSHMPPLFFESRPSTDLLHRYHYSDAISTLPLYAARLLQQLSVVVLAIAIILLLSKAAALVAALIVLSILCLAYYFYRKILPIDQHQRAAEAQNLHLYQHAIQARTPLKAHDAERVLLVEHERQVARWMKLCRATLRWRGVSVGIAEVLIATGMVLVTHVQLAEDENPLSILIVLYWYALAVSNARALSYFLVAWVPHHTTIMMRVLEALTVTNAFENSARSIDADQSESSKVSAAASVEFDAVTLVRGGRNIISDVSFRIEAGEHVAIVGRSGAGKSSIVSLLLGHETPFAGKIRLSGKPLAWEELERVRDEIAWVDPTVYLWNDSLLRNLYVGGNDFDVRPEELYRLLDFSEVVARFDEGGASSIGEEGKLLSGGEGQRLRLGRVLLKSRPKLIVMDEAFRGVDTARRDTLLRFVRRKWQGCTMVYITHDYDEALQFDRVLVAHDGRLAEQGKPDELMVEGTLFHRLLTAHVKTREVWRDPSLWRRVEVARREITIKHEPIGASAPVEAS